MDIDEHVKAIQEHGGALADAAQRAGLDAAVPTCPDWNVRDLVAHQGMVHRWAATVVRTAATDPSTLSLETAPADAQLLDWFRDGHAGLVDALTGAPPDVACWAFLPAPSPLAFWARRQAHETAIHRADAESAGDARIDVDPALAVDGIEELLFGFYARKRGPLVADPPRTLGLRTTDTGADDAWTVVIGPEGREVSRGDARGECVVSGRASDLYQLLWNRHDRTGLDVTGLDVAGDDAVLALWRDKARVTWS